MIEKYGKSIKAIKDLKQLFFDDNDLLVKKNDEYAKKYKEGPIRTKCKMCETSLDSGISYYSHGIEYIICSKCKHVNGRYKETAEYHKYMYCESDYGSYTYNEKTKETYDSRVNNIYRPKADFLSESLNKNKIGESIRVFDIGAGSGYFVSALDDIGINSVGVEISKNQVNFGNNYIHNNKMGNSLKIIESDDLITQIKNAKSFNVISAIGVLEHLLDFHSVLQAIKNNSNFKYLYIMVPMFGLSNILETLLPDVFNRHLGGAHTHVFSNESIDYMQKFYDMEIIAKWQFGTDIMDLYRMCIVKNNKQLDDIIFQKFYKCIDEMQLILDKNTFCSEIHVLFKINR